MNEEQTLFLNKRLDADIITYSEYKFLKYLYSEEEYILTDYALKQLANDYFKNLFVTLESEIVKKIFSAPNFTKLEKRLFYCYIKDLKVGRWSIGLIQTDKRLSSKQVLKNFESYKQVVYINLLNRLKKY